jgi:Niemann-Pick C1 protein
MVRSKFSLGLFGIIIVLVAISSSVGLFSFMGVRVTLIIAEVIPFLALAVGVDNVFILVHELDRQNAMHTSIPEPHSESDDDGIDDDDELDRHLNSTLPPEERVARAVARMGPSILLSSATEVVAFSLGAFVPMPAVRNFAMYAAGSVLIGAILQVTVFVSAMVLDLKRTEVSYRRVMLTDIQSGRMDCFPCFRVRGRVRLDEQGHGSSEDVLTYGFRKYYAPTLLKTEVKHAVLAVFGGMFLLSIVGIQKIKLGLGE